MDVKKVKEQLASAGIEIYRTRPTEIHVADDGYICLQLPDFVPRGKAMVTVTFQEPEDDDRRDVGDDDDRDDIEWWEADED